MVKKEAMTVKPSCDDTVCDRWGALQFHDAMTGASHTGNNLIYFCLMFRRVKMCIQTNKNFLKRIQSEKKGSNLKKKGTSFSSQYKSKNVNVNSWYKNQAKLKFY